MENPEINPSALGDGSYLIGEKHPILEICRLCGEPVELGHYQLEIVVAGHRIVKRYWPVVDMVAGIPTGCTHPDATNGQHQLSG